MLAENDQRCTGGEAATCVAERQQSLIGGPEVEHDDGHRARTGRWRLANAWRWRIVDHAGPHRRKELAKAHPGLLERSCRGAGKAVVSAVEVEGEADVHGKAWRALTDLDDAETLPRRQRRESLRHQGAQRVSALQSAAGADDLLQQCRQRRLLRADLRQSSPSGEQCGQVQADPSDRMDDLEVVRIVGDQAVPDVLGGRLLPLIRDDRPALGRCGERQVIFGEAEQIGEEGGALGTGGLVRDDRGRRQHAVLVGDLLQGTTREAAAQTVQERIDFFRIASVRSLEGCSLRDVGECRADAVEGQRRLARGQPGVRLRCRVQGEKAQPVAASSVQADGAKTHVADGRNGAAGSGKQCELGLQ
ncbi:MAG: hypothetical protein AW07_04513 [Candidatus Accumulibacter sp. SK-11]|nr:MAG: hypothetical protein AW07_04513 [Candidatus Accumulibacter sp. SK-11]